MLEASIVEIADQDSSLRTQKEDKFRDWLWREESLSNAQIRTEARELAEQFAKILKKGINIKSSRYILNHYTSSDIRTAADDIIEQYGIFRQEYIERDEQEYKQHSEENEKLAKKIGIKNLLSLMPVSPESVRWALEKGDRFLNTIPIKLWDRAAANLWIPELSFAEKVSVLKHVATWHYA